MNRRMLLHSGLGAALASGLAVRRSASHAEESEGAAPPETVVFIIRIHLKPGQAAAFLRLLAPVLDAMRHEPSFINAALHQDPEDPDRFMLYETWADLEDVTQVQIHRDYRQGYLAQLPQMLRAPRDIEVWRPLRGDFTFFAAAVPSASG